MSESKQIEMCSIGKESGTECHKKNYTQVVNLTSIMSISTLERDLLSMRSGISYELIETVCEHHKIFFLKKYESYQTSCSDPFKYHKKKITKTLRKITLELSQKINKIPFCEKSIPGQKICDACRVKVNEHLLKSVSKCSEEQDSDNDDINFLETSISKEKTLDEINTSLEDLGESPIKFHGIASHSKSNYAKRKIESAYSTLKNKVSKVIEQEIPSETDSKKLSMDIKQKADDMDALIVLIKTKLETCITRREKIQLLTLVPASWSRKKVCEEFHVSEYTVRKARELLKDKGLMALPEPRKGKTLDENIIQLVKTFYQNDEYSRIMPGSKDKVSISRNMHMQKRLLLVNLNELYSAFKIEHPDIKIGISKFCMLRPKWCIFAGSSGTHSVCVCTIHQNVTLLLHACSIEETYHDLINLLVCSKDNRDCMLRHCTECPSNECLKKFLISKFEEWDPDDEITYSSWVSTDRTQQLKLTVTFDEYLTTVIKSLETLVPHSFIAKSQAKYLKEMKMNLPIDEAIVLLDFSENYSYVIQDEAQGYHWTRDSCSLHIAVIYSHIELSKELIATSFCILSEDLEHDVAFVYETQKVITQYIKDKFPNIRNVHYFSDGCAAQYKNCKNFINLCHHNQDFSLTGTWNFFATSHGKSPCDGIGGTVKRLVTRASLQMCSGNVINSDEKLFNFCKTSIGNIKFYLIKKQTLLETRQKLEARFSKAKTIPGTRSYHHFIPLSEDSIGMKRISYDENFDTIFNFSGDHSSIIKMSQICINSYIACIYDNHWFFGLVLSKHEDEGDVKVKFMHPYSPAPCYYWPILNEDICFVPICNIISCVNPPITKGSGRMYYFLENEVNLIQRKYTLLTQNQR